jgi:hypothetical protein
MPVYFKIVKIAILKTGKVLFFHLHWKDKLKREPIICDSDISKSKISPVTRAAIFFMYFEAA